MTPTTQKSFMPSQQEMEQLIAVCKTVSACPYYQKLGPGGVLAIWLTAREMGLPPMMCLNGGMYTFSGAVSLSSQLMNMMIVNAGHEVDILECTATACEIRITRGDRKHKKDYKPFTYRYTIEDARIAGLANKDVWKKNPRDMLFNRTLSGASRKHTPEATMGAYAIGEIDSEQEIVDHSPATPIAQVVEQPNPINEPKAQLTQIEFEKPPEWDHFIGKHGLTLDQDNKPATDKMEYVLATVKKAKMDLNQVISSAIKHEDIFEQRFKKWQDDKYDGEKIPQ